jgi:hypothetical protein
MSTFPETGTQPLVLPVLSGDWVPCACCGAWVEVWHALPIEGEPWYWICDLCSEEQEPTPIPRPRARNLGEAFTAQDQLCQTLREIQEDGGLLVFEEPVPVPVEEEE